MQESIETFKTPHELPENNQTKERAQYRNHRSSQRNLHQSFSPMVHNFQIERCQRQFRHRNESEGTILGQAIRCMKEYKLHGVTNIHQMPIAQYGEFLSRTENPIAKWIHSRGNSYHTGFKFRVELRQLHRLQKMQSMKFL
jgi:hypothetical protein